MRSLNCFLCVKEEVRTGRDGWTGWEGGEGGGEGGAGVSGGYRSKYT